MVPCALPANWSAQTGNLLVDDNWRVAVVDFGISRMIDLTMSKKNIGTPIYSAPEARKSVDVICMRRFSDCDCCRCLVGSLTVSVQTCTALRL